MPPVRHRDRAEGVRAEPVGVQVALGRARASQDAGASSPYDIVQPMATPSADGQSGAEAVAGALVEDPVADDDLGHPDGDGHSGLLHGRAGRAACVVDPREEAQLSDAGRLGDGDLGAGVLGEGDQSVHILWTETGVVQRGPDVLGGESQLATAGVLGWPPSESPGAGS